MRNSIAQAMVLLIDTLLFIFWLPLTQKALILRVDKLDLTNPT